MRLAAGIHRLGSNPIVNSYLLEESGEVTIIDAGMPGLYATVATELTAMGRSWSDVRALLLTHGHTDHVGFAERARTERHVPVWIHEADAPLARGEAPNPAKGGDSTRLGPMLNFLWYGLRHGGLRRPVVGEVSTFGDGATLDVPGSPRVVLTPGHTPGSAALHVAERDAIFVGDALCTYAVTSGRHGPQVAPFSADQALAVESLARLEPLDAGIVLPGHGEVWRDGISAAVDRVRQTVAVER